MVPFFLAFAHIPHARMHPRSHTSMALADPAAAAANTPPLILHPPFTASPLLFAVTAEAVRAIVLCTTFDQRRASANARRTHLVAPRAGTAA